MRGKRGWIRIVESVIAVLIIAGALVFFYTRNIDRGGKAEKIYNIERNILEEVARNSSMREVVLSGNKDNMILRSFIEERIVKYGLTYDISICLPDAVCSLIPWPEDIEEVYAEEILISSTLQNYSPKKLKLFVWGS